MSKDIFEKKLEQCDVEYKWQYEYLDSQICDIEDEELQIAEQIEELKVERKICEKMGENDEAKEIENDIKENEEYLEYLYRKEDVMEDLWEDMICNILKD